MTDSGDQAHADREAAGRQWPRPPSDCALAPGEIHIWSVDLDAVGDRTGLRSFIATSERRRADRFTRRVDRDRYVAGRYMLRWLLGRYTGVAPADVRFEYGPFGKPALAGAGAPAGLEFNASGSEGLALYAITRGFPVGVDVERVRPVPESADIVERDFSAAERDAWRALPGRSRTAAFFDAWTRKEAVLKALGTGLSRSLASIEVTFGPAPRIRAIDGDARRGESWTLRTLAPRPGFVGALAAERRGAASRCWHFDPQATVGHPARPAP